MHTPAEGDRPILIAARLATAVLCATVLAGVVGCGSGQDASNGELSEQAADGRDLVANQGCESCHSADGTDGVGPSWQGLAGSEVTLDDGTTVTADDEYLARSVQDPSAQLVEGFNAIMPERSLDAEQVDAIVAYLRSIDGAER